MPTPEIINDIPHNYSVFEALPSSETRKIINEALSYTRANEIGVFGNGSRCRKKAKKDGRHCSVMLLSREIITQNPEGSWYQSIGHRELIIELFPGQKPPYYLAMRVTRGSLVPILDQVAAIESFQKTKEEETFAHNYQNGIRKMIIMFVESLREQGQSANKS